MNDRPSHLVRRVILRTLDLPPIHAVYAAAAPDFHEFYLAGFPTAEHRDEWIVRNGMEIVDAKPAQA